MEEFCETKGNSKIFRFKFEFKNKAFVKLKSYKDYKNLLEIKIIKIFISKNIDKCTGKCNSRWNTNESLILTRNKPKHGGKKFIWID